MTNTLRKKKSIVSSAFTKSIIAPMIRKKENLFMRAISIKAQSFKSAGATSIGVESTPVATAKR